MGLFDSIYFNCPDCNEEIEAQSKSGGCGLASYNHKEVPIDVAQDCNRHAPFKCDNCGGKWEFENGGRIAKIALIISRVE